MKSFIEVKKSFVSDIQELKNGNYQNLIYHDFDASIDSVEGVYNIEVAVNNSYKDKSVLENFRQMMEVTDKFF